MKVFIVIPLFSNGIDINSSEVKVFTEYKKASEYINTLTTGYYELIESELIS
jgi:hypothetical protein